LTRARSTRLFPTTLRTGLLTTTLRASLLTRAGSARLLSRALRTSLLLGAGSTRLLSRALRAALLLGRRRRGLYTKVIPQFLEDVLVLLSHSQKFPGYVCYVFGSLGRLRLLLGAGFFALRRRRCLLGGGRAFGFRLSFRRLYEDLKDPASADLPDGRHVVGRLDVTNQLRALAAEAGGRN